MKEIPLTRGMVALVDDEDYGWLSQFKWHASSNGGGEWYARRHCSPRYMHRAIVEVPAGVLVDHANQNTLDNRRLNLRAATKSQNGQNQSVRQAASKRSLFKGVTFFSAHSRRCPWFVRVAGTFVGYFETEEEAARAYNTKASELFGEFACLNVLPEVTTTR